MTRFSDRYAVPGHDIIIIDSSALLRAGVAACGGHGRRVGALALQRADVFDMRVGRERRRKSRNPGGDIG
jgi:hypothetical protein